MPTGSAESHVTHKSASESPLSPADQEQEEATPEENDNAAEQEITEERSQGHGSNTDDQHPPVTSAPPEIATPHTAFPPRDGLSFVRVNQKLQEIADILPSMDTYEELAKKDVGKVEDIWKEKTGKSRLLWGGRETRILLACVLKVEQNQGGYLVELKRGKLTREPIKSVDNQIGKTVQTYVAWNLRVCGNPLFAHIDNVQVKNHWAKLKSTWDAIARLTQRSGGPFQYDEDHGFSNLSDDMGEEFDRLVKGKVPKGHEHSDLIKDAQLVKELRKGAWPYYKDMKAIFATKGSSATVTGTFAKDFVNRNKNSENVPEAAAGGSTQGPAVLPNATTSTAVQGPVDAATKARSRPGTEMNESDQHNTTKRPRVSKQRHTIDAVADVGEGNKAIAHALEDTVQAEHSRSAVDSQILAELQTANKDKIKDSLYRRQREAAEIVSSLPEFDAYTTDQQFGIQEWITQEDHAEQFSKVIPKLRGVWLRKALKDV